MANWIPKRRVLVIAAFVALGALATGIAWGSSPPSDTTNGAVEVAPTLEEKVPPTEPPPAEVEYVPGAAEIVSPAEAEQLGLHLPGQNARVCRLSADDYVVIQVRTADPDADPFPPQSPTAKTWNRPC